MSDPKRDESDSYFGPHQRALRARSKKSKTINVLAMCMLAAGAALFGWGCFELTRAHASNRWPTTTATIIHASVLKVQQRKADHASFSYYPKVEYHYTVLGEPYTSNRIAFGGMTAAGQPEAQKIVDQYPPGTTLSVRYDPNDPSVAVLRAGYRLPAYFMITMGLAVCAISLLFLRRWQRERARR